MLDNEAGTVRGARVQRAAECSPGRKPGVKLLTNDPSPARGERCSSRQLGNLPISCRPLRGLRNVCGFQIPGLTPRATLCRSLRRLVEPLIPTTITVRAIFLFAFFLFTFTFFFESAHTQTPQAARGVFRLKVKYKSGDATKELSRKRFFLIKGTLEENKILIEKLKQTNVISRECYYRGKGASEALIKWLKENDCESVYCRTIDEKYLTGSDAVPEFQTAYEKGLREFKAPELARLWLTVNLPRAIRSGFYDEKQKATNALVTESRISVASVMTDRHGSAYLTDIEPGFYTISNLVASETEKTSILWACEKEIKATDLATAIRRPFILSNEKDPKVKCELIERPLPVCEK